MAAGDRAALLARCRSTATLVLSALRRLNEEQLNTPVHCHMFHDGQCVLDEPRPWGAVAIQVQAGVHLPAHVEQLRNLRQLESFADNLA